MATQATLQFSTLFHRGQELVEREGSEGGGGVAHRVRDDQFPAMQEAAAGVNDIRHIAFALGFVGLSNGSRRRPMTCVGIFQIEQKRADAILAHGAHAVAEHEPARFRFDRRTAIAHLDEFPRMRGSRTNCVGVARNEMLSENIT